LRIGALFVAAGQGAVREDEHQISGGDGDPQA
jgi:hypothetical protein